MGGGYKDFKNSQLFPENDDKSTDGSNYIQMGDFTMPVTVQPVVCIEREVFDRYDFLKGIPNEERCVPPENGSRCAFLAVRGRKGDGVMELHCYTPRNAPVAILNENGDIYQGDSIIRSKSYYAAKPKSIATNVADKPKARSFFIEMFGDAEFTPPVRKEICKEAKDCPEPNHE